MQKIILSIFIFASISCFSAVNYESYSNFMKDYTARSDYYEKSWNEIVYSIEKDYEDDIVLFLINEHNDHFTFYYKHVLEHPAYIESLKNDSIYYLEYRNLALTLIQKDRLELLEALLKKFSTQDISDFVVYYGFYHGTSPVHSKGIRPILNVVIDDIEDSLKYVKFLVERGVDINKVLPSDGWKPEFPLKLTPLQIAIDKRKYDVAEYLIQKGADKQAGLVRSISNKDSEGLILLLNYGAKVSQETVQLAIAAGDEEILNLILETYTSNLTNEEYIDVTQASLNDFMVNYLKSNEKKQLFWPELVYAIENDYDDSIVLYCMDNFPHPLGKLYRKEMDDYWSKKYYHNIAITALKKNRLDIFHALVAKNFVDPNIALEISEIERIWDTSIIVNYHLKSFLKPILNVAIEDFDNSLELVEMLLNLNVPVNVELSKYNLDVYQNPHEAFNATIWPKLKLTALQSAINLRKFDIAQILVDKGAILLPGLNIAIKNLDKEAVEFMLNLGAIPTKAEVDIALKIGDSEIAELIMSAYFQN